MISVPINATSDEDEASVGETDMEEKLFYPITKSRKFITLPTGPFVKEEVINVIKPEAEGEPFIFGQDRRNHFDETNEWKDLTVVIDNNEEDTRRRVYWASPGLIQERYSKSIFPQQDIPEGVRPTLAYVHSDEMVSKGYPTAEKTYLTLANDFIKKCPESEDSLAVDTEKRRPQKKRWLKSMLKLIGIK